MFLRGLGKDPSRNFEFFFNHCPLLSRLIPTCTINLMLLISGGFIDTCGLNRNLTTCGGKPLPPLNLPPKPWQTTSPVNSLHPALFTMSFDASAALSISDPDARAVSSSCFDFLLIELVPMAERLAKELATDENEPEDEEVRETTYFRLESIGYRVGQGLAER